MTVRENMTQDARCSASAYAKSQGCSHASRRGSFAPSRRTTRQGHEEMAKDNRQRRLRGRRLALVACFCLLLVPGKIVQAGEVYRVGPQEEYVSVDEVTADLEPGDTVLLCGDLRESFVLSRSGTRSDPITVRGIVGDRGGSVSRPTITVDNSGLAGVVVRGDWNVISNLQLTGAGGRGGARSAIFVAGSNVTVRNCVFHHNDQALDSVGGVAEIRVQFCEFDSNGRGSRQHSVYLTSNVPGAKAIIEHCYFHDAVGGVLLKSRVPRNVVRYNWFEDAFYSAVNIVDAASLGGWPEEEMRSLYPMHTDMLGNVFFQGWSPGPRYALLSLGGEHETSPGTEGDFNLAHNVFLMTRSAPKAPGVAILVHGNVNKVAVWNNVFLGLGVVRFKVYERGTTWETPERAAFIARHGRGEPVVEGVGNWISLKASGIPEGLRETLRGRNPGFVDLCTFDFHPLSESPLLGAACVECTTGRIIELVPEFEPVRGIGQEVERIRRGDTSRLSIGPFSVRR